MKKLLLAAMSAPALAVENVEANASGRGPTILNSDVASGSPSELLQALEETGQACLSVWIVRGRVYELHQYAVHARPAPTPPPATPLRHPVPR